MKALEGEMGSSDFWSDQETAKKVSKRAADLRSEVGRWEGFLKEISDLKEEAAANGAVEGFPPYLPSDSPH